MGIRSGDFSHTRRMPSPQVMLGENGEEYVLDAFGPATTNTSLDTVYSGGAPPGGPPPSPTASPTPPLAPYPNPVERQQQKAADCNRMVKEALDMCKMIRPNRWEGVQGRHNSARHKSARHNSALFAVAPKYVQHLQKLGERCGHPLSDLHHHYDYQLRRANALDVYDGSGAPIAERSRKIAADLTRRHWMWDQEVLRGQLTWADWFVNAMGRRPRW